MALIETEEAAGRLARVIASDIQLYNKQKIENGADLTAEVEEGYRLFRARVAPSLLPVFQTVLTDKGLLGGKTPAPARVSPLAAALMTPASARPVAASAPPAPRYDAPTEPSAPAEVASAPMDAPEDVPMDDLPAVPAPEPPSPRFAAFASPDSDGPLPPADEPSVTEERPTFEGARRLARVIISDIRIYNPKKIEAGEDLTREIEEGRTLFKARIGADLLPLFESVLEESGLVKAAPKAAPVRVPTPAASPARVPTPVASPASVRRPTPFPSAPRRLPTPAAPAPAAPVAASPVTQAYAEPRRAATPFPFDEPTQALSDHPVYGSEPAPPRVATPVPPDEAASALSRVDTPFPGAPLRTPTPFLEGPIMIPSKTPGPSRRGLPPPIPVAARTLRPVPLPLSATPAPMAQTPPPVAAQSASTLGAPTPLPAARFPVVGVPDAAPISVTTSHRRKPPMRLALAAAAIATALALAYVLFQM